MAQLLPIYGGYSAGNWGELDWLRCVSVFELDEFCRVEEHPRFEKMAACSSVPGTIVVRLRAVEARRYGVRPGWFYSPLDGMAAMGRLYGERVAPLDRDNGAFSARRTQAVSDVSRLGATAHAARRRHTELMQKSRECIAQSRTLLASCWRDES